jgi:transposase
MRIDHSKKFVNGKVYINGIEGFWSFAKERLMKYHGVNPKKFPLYQKRIGVQIQSPPTRHYDDLVKCISEYSLVVSIE